MTTNSDDSVDAFAELVKCTGPGEITAVPDSPPVLADYLNAPPLGPLPHDETELIREFGAAAHQDGIRLRNTHACVDVVNALCGGRLAEKHFEALGGKGKDSRFPAWCRTYGGPLSRRTIDRWRRIYQTFRDDFEREPALFTNVQLAALYWVVENGCSKFHYSRFLELARTASAITTKEVKTFVPKKERAVRTKSSSAQTGKPSSRHVLCTDADLSKAIKKLEKQGFTFFGTHLACIEVDGQNRHIYAVSGVRNGAQPTTTELGSWFSAGDGENAIADLRANLAAMWPNAKIDVLSKALRVDG